MKNKIPVSVFIIAKNEEDRIAYSINSVINWADEVIVIDSYSTDNTVNLSKKLGASVLQNKWQGYGPQKVFGEKICKNKWILNIDADEELSQKLQKEIISMFEGGKEPLKDAYHIPIKTVRFFQNNPAFLAPSNDPLRFYNKKNAGFKNSVVHDSVILKTKNGTTGHLKHHVNHRCFRSYSHAIEKINYYSTLQAEDLIKRNISPKKIRILFEPFFAFFKAYFLRRYCFWGIDGITESIIYAFARTMRLAKAREILLKKNNKI